MLTVMTQMAALIVCGIAWRYSAPDGLDPTTTRKALTSMVYYLFLPALVLMVLWQAEIGLDSLKIALTAACGVIASILLMRAFCNYCKMPPAATGAIILAAAFPNATYLGLPVLEAALGHEARSIAIQYDLFACTPLLLTLGVALAAHFGESEQKQNPLISLIKVPALWAAIIAIVLNLNHVPLPSALADWLKMLANGVAPIMLISLGLSLHFSRSQLQMIRPMAPAIVIKLILMPLVALAVASLAGLQGITLSGVVLEAAMPSMVLGMVLCDRYKLDASLYAATVTVTTALSFISLSVWFSLLHI